MQKLNFSKKKTKLLHVTRKNVMYENRDAYQLPLAQK